MVWIRFDFDGELGYDRHVSSKRMINQRRK